MPIFGIESSGFGLAFVYNFKVYFGLFPVLVDGEFSLEPWLTGC